MYNKKESAVSPVVAVVLLLGIVGVIVAMAGVTVFSNIDNIMINEVKKVDVSVEISDDKISVTPAYNKNKDELLSYSVYLVMSDGNPVEPFTQNSDAPLDINPKDYGVNIDDLAYINVIGHFNDNTDVVIFTGKIKDGYIVYTSNPEPAKGFTVTFNSNGGKFSDGTTTKTVTKNAGETLKSEDFPYVSKDASDFDGWYSDSSFSGSRVTSVSSTTTLYAKWVEGFTVTFNSNGGVFTEGGNTKIVTKNAGETLKSEDFPKSPGDVSNTPLYLEGWYSDLSFSGPRVTSVSSTTTLYANWVSGFTVTYIDEKGFLTGSDLPTDGKSYSPKSTVLVKGIDSSLYTKTDSDGVEWHFNGWRNDNDDIIYGEDKTFTITGNTVMKAVWTKETTYFKYGTTPDPKQGIGASYSTLKDLINGINLWKPGTIVIDESSEDGKNIVAVLNSDIPLESHPLTIQPGWSLTLRVGDDFASKTTDNGAYPLTKPHIWAAPTHQVTSLVVILSTGRSSIGTLTIDDHIIIDGNEMMTESAVKLTPIKNDNEGGWFGYDNARLALAKLTVNDDKTLEILNGNTNGNRITTNGGGIFNAGEVITNGNGLIIIKKCLAKNGGGFYNSDYGSYLGVDINGIESIAKIKVDISECSAIEGSEGEAAGAGGGIYNHKSLNIKSGSVITNNFAGQKGGGVFNYEGSVTITNTEISFNRAINTWSPSHGKGGGIFSYIAYTPIYGVEHGYLKLNYDDSLINSIYGNEATNQGGGICCYDNGEYDDDDYDDCAYVYYGDKLVSDLDVGDVKRWFQNRLDSTPANIASGVSNNYYPGLEVEYYTKGIFDINEINKWAQEYYGSGEFIFDTNGNVISEREIIVDGAAIKINNQEIKGDKEITLNIVSAPDYKDSLLSISGESIISANIVVDGKDCNGAIVENRKSALVVIFNSAELIINDGYTLTVQNGYKGGSGGGIDNAGTITNKGTLTVQSNKATSGGGIYNKGTINNVKFYTYEGAKPSKGTIEKASEPVADNGYYWVLNNPTWKWSYYTTNQGINKYVMNENSAEWYDNSDFRGWRQVLTNEDWVVKKGYDANDWVFNERPDNVKPLTPHIILNENKASYYGNAIYNLGTINSWNDGTNYGIYGTGNSGSGSDVSGTINGGSNIS